MTFKPRHIAKACLLLIVAGSAIASSHREAPFITTAPKVDGTDFYMFKSYETGKTDNVTLIANYLPLQDAYGGPNYFSLDSNGLYEIHIDNTGDGKEDLTFQFKFQNTLANAGKGIELNVGGKNVAIPLRQSNQITSAGDPDQSYRETFTVDVVRGDRRTGVRTAAVNLKNGSTTFDKPVDNIGVKTFNNNYAGYANSAEFIQGIDFKIPGCTQAGKVFVGQRKEAFSVALGIVFDLVNASGATITNENNAALNGPFGELNDKNVTSLALEVPASCLTNANGDKVIGGWTTASLRQGRLLNGATPSGLQASEKAGGAWTQVSRLGMPLVNEVVIGLKDKDKFNGSKPFESAANNDATNFADYVTNPTFPALLETLFFNDGVRAPTNFPRTDLMTAFLTGIPGLNRINNANSQGRNGPLTEMLRLNTSTPVITTAAPQNPLGVIAGDNAGFPNGRRLYDDVVDITLRVAMGKLCSLNGASGDSLGVGCNSDKAPSGNTNFVDTVRAQVGDFQMAFPYMNTPLGGTK